MGADWFSTAAILGYKIIVPDDFRPSYKGYKHNHIYYEQYEQEYVYDIKKKIQYGLKGTPYKLFVINSDTIHSRLETVCDEEKFDIPVHIVIGINVHNKDFSYIQSLTFTDIPRFDGIKYEDNVTLTSGIEWDYSDHIEDYMNRDSDSDCDNDYDSNCDDN